MKTKIAWIIGHQWPEPNTTAAGVRMTGLIQHFQAQGYAVHFSSAAQRTAYTELPVEVETHEIKLNDSGFDAFAKALQPHLVIFDRFMTEEQYGWRVADACPDAIRVLDTEDLHFLREARRVAAQGKALNLYTDLAKRELASILRSDLSLMVSKAEFDLLVNSFSIPEKLLLYVPFSYPLAAPLASYQDRCNIVTLGNLNHAPNVDSVKRLKQQIWPELIKQLSDCEVHVYGAYAPQQISEMHDSRDRFLVKGWVADASAMLQNYRLQLAPLSYGAGIKGKILQSFACGTPVVTTPLGAEGIIDSGSELYTHCVASSEVDFIEKAIDLYTNKPLWNHIQSMGYDLMENFQNYNASALMNQIDTLANQLENHRQRHFIGQILNHQTHHASRYMGKWIEAKNKK